MPGKRTTSIQKVLTHFRKSDQVIFAVIKNMELSPLAAECGPNGYFAKLCREIISQQLAGTAARAIVKRFEDLFPRRRITPEQVLAFTEDHLRSIGMSYAKARYVRNLAEKTLAGELEFTKFPRMLDKEVIIELTKVKGIGRWTAEMFLIFTLGREDVFSHGDLGLQKGFELLYGKQKERAMDGIIQRWSPYKSYASLTLWHAKDFQA